MTPTSTAKSKERKIYLILRSNIQYLFKQTGIEFTCEESDNNFVLRSLPQALTLSVQYYPHNVIAQQPGKELF